LGDGWLPLAGGPREIEAGLAALEPLLAERGRTRDSIWVAASLRGDPDAEIEQMVAHAEAAGGGGGGPAGGGGRVPDCRGMRRPARGASRRRSRPRQRRLRVARRHGVAGAAGVVRRIGHAPVRRKRKESRRRRRIRAPMSMLFEEREVIEEAAD